MEYEKLYNEAIERAKKHCADYVVETIFPELAESEDERIRKAMIDLFKHEREEGITVLHYGVNIECMIDWLEKQGEHDKFRESIQVGDKVTRNRDGMLVNLSQLKRVAKKDEKQREQKPDTDFSDLRTWKYIVDAVLTEKELIGQYRDRPFTEEVAKKLQKRFGKIEQKPAWSEEDKVMLDKVIERLHKHSAGDKEYLDIYYWLIALKDRVQPKQEWGEKYIADVFEKVGLAKIAREQGYDALTEAIQSAMIELSKFTPQPKQEWSEEDETVLDNLIYALANDRIGNDRDEYVDWLKSLKDRVLPQPKHEWSGGDEAHLHSLITHLEQWIERHPNTTGADIQGENITWLKSLRPQSQWKPSEEQMIELHRVISGCSYDIEPLVEIEEQLKKLME